MCGIHIKFYSFRDKIVEMISNNFCFAFILKLTAFKF